MRALTTLLLCTIILTALSACSLSDDSGYDDNESIPLDATVMSRGQGNLVFVAPSSGTVYIVNRDESVRIFTGTLTRNDRVVIRPEQNRILVNGRVVEDDRIRNNAAHAIYWSGKTNNDRARLPEALASAERLESGRGDLSHRVNRPGRIWVWDATDGTVIYRGHVDRDARVRVLPGENRVLIDGEAVEKRSRLKDGNVYQIYYERG